MHLENASEVLCEKYRNPDSSEFFHAEDVLITVWKEAPRSRLMRTNEKTQLVLILKNEEEQERASAQKNWCFLRMGLLILLWNDCWDSP